MRKGKGGKKGDRGTRSTDDFVGTGNCLAASILPDGVEKDKNQGNQKLNVRTIPLN